MYGITPMKVGRGNLTYVQTYVEYLASRGIRVPKYVFYDLPHNWDLYYHGWAVMPKWGGEVMYSPSEGEYIWVGEDGGICHAYFIKDGATEAMRPVLRIERFDNVRTVTFTTKITDPVAFIQDPTLGPIHEGQVGYPTIKNPRIVRVTIRHSPKEYSVSIEDAPGHPTTATRFLVEDGVWSDFLPHILSTIMSAMTIDDMILVQEWKIAVNAMQQPTIDAADFRARAKEFLDDK